MLVSQAKGGHTMVQIRQGDVWIEYCDTIPTEALKVRPTERGYVLAEGEATGHAHTIEATPDVELYELNGVLYCRVRGETVVHHEEHAPVTLAPGAYRVRRQIEETAGGPVRSAHHVSD